MPRLSSSVEGSRTSLFRLLLVLLVGMVPAVMGDVTVNADYYEIQASTSIV